MSLRSLGVLLSLLASLGCARSDAPAAGDGGAHEPSRSDAGEAAPLVGRVRLKPSVLAAARIHTERAHKKELPMTLELPGEVAADPDRSMRIAARVPGRIAAVHFKEGAHVEAGALLAVIESAELAKTASIYASAVARVEASEQNATRLLSLSRSGLAAHQEVLDAQAHAQAQRAEAQAARRTLLAFGIADTQLDHVSARFELRAAFAGHTVSRNATVGQTISAEHVLCDLIDLEHAYFVGRLFEKSLAQVRVGQTAEVRLNAYPDEVLPGIIETIGKQLDPSARTVVARIVIQNRNDLLKVGLFGQARITLSSDPAPAPALVLPLTALTRIAERDVVFIQLANDDFEVRAVTPGPAVSGQVQILAGLREGEAVVTEGVFTLKSGLLKSSFAEED